MSTDTSRSEQVVEDYKKHKLARSALRRIQNLIREFEAGRAFDLRLALFGLIIVFALTGVSAYFLLSADSITLY